MSDLRESIGELRDTLIANTTILQRIEKWIEKHEDEDDKRFKDLTTDVNKINAKMIFGSGFIAAITSIITLWVKGH